jgi:AcrR family transcriptional regulator
MSKNEHLPLAASLKKTDARVRRTRDALGDALIELMQEKPFDTITVQDVLDRAHVSRSTFYSHYSDKDDLLMSDAEEFFESISMALSVHGDKSDRVFPVQEFFVHLSDVQPFYKA